VTAQQVQLERLERVRRNPDVGERAEAGVDAVDGVLALGGAIDHRARRLNLRHRRRGEADRLEAIGDRHQLIERQRRTVEEDHPSSIAAFARSAPARV
jgi:hypothetical protein